MRQFCALRSFRTGSSGILPTRLRAIPHKIDLALVETFDHADPGQRMFHPLRAEQRLSCDRISRGSTPIALRCSFSPHARLQRNAEILSAPVGHGSTCALSTAPRIRCVRGARHKALTVLATEKHSHLQTAWDNLEVLCSPYHAAHHAPEKAEQLGGFSRDTRSVAVARSSSKPRIPPSAARNRRTVIPLQPPFFRGSALS